MDKCIARIKDQIKEYEKETGRTANYLVVLLSDDENHFHQYRTTVKAADNHHFLDMLTEIMRFWKKNKMKGSKDDTQLLHLMTERINDWKKESHLPNERDQLFTCKMDSGD